MIKAEEHAVMKATLIYLKDYLKPEEAHLLCNIGRTQFAKKCEELGIYKNSKGYYKREDVNRILSDEANPIIEAAKKLRIKPKK